VFCSDKDRFLILFLLLDNSIMFWAFSHFFFFWSPHVSYWKIYTMVWLFFRTGHKESLCPFFCLSLSWLGHYPLDPFFSVFIGFCWFFSNFFTPTSFFFPLFFHLGVNCSSPSNPDKYGSTMRKPLYSLTFVFFIPTKTRFAR